MLHLFYALHMFRIHIMVKITIYQFSLLRNAFEHKTNALIFIQSQWSMGPEHIFAQF